MYSEALDGSTHSAGVLAQDLTIANDEEEEADGAATAVEATAPSSHASSPTHAALSQKALNRNKWGAEIARVAWSLQTVASSARSLLWGGTNC